MDTNNKRQGRTRLLRETKNTKRKRHFSGPGFFSRKAPGKLERSLELEIKQKHEEEKQPDAKFCGRYLWRIRFLLHSQPYLATVVLLCILECCLVMCGLILELSIVNQMGEDTTDLTDTHELCNEEEIEQNHYRVTMITAAHGLTYASVSIVTLLLAVTIFKILCYGRLILRRKFEMFDGLSVTASFLMDILFLEAATSGSILENARVISVILPLKVLRIVNSMIIALYDNEHNKLLLMFKSKGYLEKQRDQMSMDVQKVDKGLNIYKRVAVEAGVPERAISKVLGDILMETQKSKSKNAVKAMVAMAMSGPDTSKTPGNKPIKKMADMSQKQPVVIDIALKDYDSTESTVKGAISATDGAAEGEKLALTTSTKTRQQADGSENIRNQNSQNNHTSVKGTQRQTSPERSSHAKRPLFLVAGDGTDKQYVCVRSPFKQRKTAKYNIFD